MSTIETTQSSFLIRYTAKLIIITEILMICTISVLYITNGKFLPTLIFLFISPLLGGIITGKISKKSKKILFKENFNKYFIITNIVIYILVYLFNFRFNLILATIYGIGALIGFFSSNKNIKQLKENMEKEETNNETFIEGEKIKVKEYNLGKFNGETIREFLKLNELKEENYILAQMVPTIKEYFLYGYFSLSNCNQYILYFDNQKLYFFELGKLSSKSIKNGFFVKFEDLQIEKLKKGLICYKIRIKFKDGSIANLQIIKKVAKLFLQKQYSEKLYNKLLEIKDKSEKEENK